MTAGDPNLMWPHLGCGLSTWSGSGEREEKEQTPARIELRAGAYDFRDIPSPQSSAAPPQDEMAAERSSYCTRQTAGI